jgi:hypothetical protein
MHGQNNRRGYGAYNDLGEIFAAHLTLVVVVGVLYGIIRAIVREHIAINVGDGRS